MLKIYQDNRDMIDQHLKEMRVEHCFTLTETYYLVTKVKEKMVEFEISQRIKDLIEEKREYLTENGHHSFNFTQEENGKWRMIIESGGVESAFFAYALEVVLGKLNKEKRERVNSGKMEIKNALDEVLARVGNKYPHRIFYKKGIFYMLVRINGAKIVFQNQCPDFLKKEIMEKLAEILEVIMKNKTSIKGGRRK